MKVFFQSSVFMIVSFILLAVCACGNESPENSSGTPQMEMSHGDEVVQSDKGGHAQSNGFDGMPPAGTKAFCPIMKHEFAVKGDSSHSIYKGKTYVFCCPGCKPKFDEDPDKYIKAKM